jgi:hypothetical protein
MDTKFIAQRQATRACLNLDVAIRSFEQAHKEMNTITQVMFLRDRINNLKTLTESVLSELNEITMMGEIDIE